MKKVALWSLAVILVFMAFGKLISGGLSRPLILPGSSDDSLPRIPGELIEVHQDGQTFLGYYARPQKVAPHSPLVVMTHGNAESMPAMDFLGLPFYKQGYSLLYIEYPGYGRAPGSASEASIYQATSNLLAHVRTKFEHTPKYTMVVGRSVGGGPAVELLHTNQAAAGLLVSTFTSIHGMARRMVGGWLADLLIQDHFDNLAKARQIKAPVFLVHGDADGVVPVQMSRELHRAFMNSEYLELPGAGHNDIYGHMTHQVWQSILDFFAQKFAI